ncbi:prolyl endopeptidase-like [Sitodiplosis mosellana]|uniref:prolyl endopeptidase-like n=1 Tax=Sitodiplosis mosellana TaxID=263140 RepID=UPI002443E01C|nr:prolyl endopeptidase-like [Sitodiplosis mosellana]
MHETMRLIVLIAFCLVVVSAAKIESYQTVRDITYPNARRDESVVDDLHGTKVADPYRWLEDPYSEETKQYVDDENKISQSFLENNDNWKKINEKLTNIWNYPKFGVPQRKGKYYFSFKNSGLQNQNVLYKQSSLDEEPSVFLDPNTLSDDGTISLQGKAFSKDGSILAYTLSESGSDWVKIKFRNVESGEDYPDLLQRAKFTSLAWTHDNKGLFYNRYDQNGDGSETDSNKNQKLYYHRVGEPQEKDVLVVEFLDNPSWLISATVSSCGKYLIVISELGNQLLYYADLQKNGPINGKIPLTPIVTKFEADYHYITNTGSKALFRTNKNAPNYRLVVIDFDNFAEKSWTTLIEENSNDVLTWAQCVDKDKIVIHYLHDVKSVLQVHSLKSGALIRKLPLEIGQIVAFNGDKKYSEIFYQLESFLTPGTIYRYDFSNPDIEPTVLREVELNLEGFDKNDFKVEQVFYPSRDGTKIPMFIVQRKTEAKKPRPCLLHAYGGFNIATQPSFKVPFLFFVYAFDGILAVANIRGGGEYGERWHDAGRLLNKQNVFDDFQTAAEYLVEQKYTIQKKIGIYGRSNGGLLIGACINQRPDLFGAAVPQVGVMDMLRFHKFTIGSAWISDYGNPDEKIDFENIYKYSPLHNVHAPNKIENQYPPTLILTGDHDDRVSPLHSLKFAANLQYAVRDNQFQKNPILLRVYSKAGHGDGKPTAKKIEEETDIYTFLQRALQIDIDI